MGGFPNFARAAFLRLVYAGEPEAAYYHHGDLDPHGFLILENLKQKTGIPFRPLEMDLATLRACFQAGHYRPLTAEDKKAMQSPLLAPYREILDFMLQHNCKVEQSPWPPWIWTLPLRTKTCKSRFPVTLLLDRVKETDLMCPSPYLAI